MSWTAERIEALTQLYVSAEPITDEAIAKHAVLKGATIGVCRKKGSALNLSKTLNICWTAERIEALTPYQFILTYANKLFSPEWHVAMRLPVCARPLCKHRWCWASRRAALAPDKLPANGPPGVRNTLLDVHKDGFLSRYRCYSHLSCASSTRPSLYSQLVSSRFSYATLTISSYAGVNTLYACACSCVPEELGYALPRCTFSLGRRQPPSRGFKTGPRRTELFSEHTGPFKASPRLPLFQGAHPGSGS